MADQSPEPRPMRVRAEAAQARLKTATQLWLATGGSGAPHLIPVAFVLDGETLITATFVRSRTMANLTAVPRARLAIGSTADVIMIDAAVQQVQVPQLDNATADRFAQVSHDPRVLPGFAYLRLTPQRIQVWNGFHEFGGRTVLRDGAWLIEPVD